MKHLVLKVSHFLLTHPASLLVHPHFNSFPFPTFFGFTSAGEFNRFLLKPMVFHYLICILDICCVKYWKGLLIRELRRVAEWRSYGISSWCYRCYASRTHFISISPKRSGNVSSRRSRMRRWWLGTTKYSYMIRILKDTVIIRTLECTLKWKTPRIR